MHTIGRALVCSVCLGVALTSGLLGIAGCGGGKKSSTPSSTIASTGRATLTVRWPERGRLIPFAAESIRIRLTNGTKLLGEALLTRPENGGNATANFDRLPPGSLVVTGTAYPNPDATGVVQAQAQTTATIVSGQTAQIRLTLQSTIDRLEIAPATLNLSVGQSTTLTATAKNAEGEVVFTLPATIEWHSQNPDIATVEAGGLVHAIANGTATIEAKETESGKTGTATVTVGGSSDEFVFNPANGHYYKIGTTTLPEGITWDAARTAANQAGGYLATITSAEENTFVFNLLNPDRYWRFNGNGSMGPWIGGYLFQAELGVSGWRWLNSETMTYTAWAANEPNNAWGNETKIQYQTPIGLPRAATWNDLPNDSSDNPVSYVIEYDYNPIGSTVAYSNNFEGAVGVEWSKRNTDGYVPGRRILGLFNNETVTLSLNSLPAHSKIALSFDMYPINTWDGDIAAAGGEVWSLSLVGGATLLNTNFNNTNNVSQSYPGTFSTESYPTLTSAIEFQQQGSWYSLYRITRVFLHSGTTLGLNFSASGMEDSSNEAWGIDNIEVRVLP